MYIFPWLCKTCEMLQKKLDNKSNNIYNKSPFIMFLVYNVLQQNKNIASNITETYLRETR
jgi:hypothetical protein